MKAVTVIFVLLTFTAVAVYLAAGDAKPGSAGALQQPREAVTTLSMHSTDAGKLLSPVEDMLQRLEERFEREPYDAMGWNLLGRSYDYLGRKKKAEAAFVRAEALGYARPVAAEHVPAALRGVIKFDPSLVENISGTETVFIFARAGSGPRTPLAVLRKPASALPIEFELKDSMVMTPEFRLSDFGDVIIGARISASGEATSNSDDLEGYSGVISVGVVENLVITVDQAVLKPEAASAGEG